jgi:hypothetical protein
MTTPRTVAGQAALSGMRPYVKRALGQTIVAIETEAAAPCLDVLREADQVLESLAAWDPDATWEDASKSELVGRAKAAHLRASSLLEARRDDG